MNYKTMRQKGPLKLDLQCFSTTADATELLDEIKSTSQQLAQALEKQEQEIKQYGTTTDKTVEQIKALEKNFDALEADFNDMAKKLGRPGYGSSGGQMKTIGKVFAESQQVKDMIERGGRDSSAVHIKSFFQPHESKDLTSDDGGVGVVVPHRVPEIIQPGEREYRVRDLLNVQPTSSNSIEYVRETGFTNNAEVQAKEGDPKAESELKFELETMSVKTIAHWIPASRQILDDAPQLQSYVDGRLVYGLKQKEDEQILYGDGLSGNIRGIMNEPDIQDQGEKPSGSNFNHIDWIRKSFTRVRLAEYPVTGVVMNPVDWEEIELAKGDDGHYLWLNVGTGQDPMLFRVPVVETTAMVEKEFIAGAFGLGAQLWDREQATVRFSEHHANFFTENMVAILAEERIALTTYRPEAFVKGKLTSETSGVEG